MVLSGFQAGPRHSEQRQNGGHSGQDEPVGAEEQAAGQAGAQTDQRGQVPLFAHPFVEEDHQEQGGHDEIQPGGVKGDQGARQAAQAGAAHPEQAELSSVMKNRNQGAVHPFRRRGGTVDGKALVTHAEDQGNLLPASAPVLVQHGDGVEQMAGVDHQRQQKSAEGLKSGKQQVRYDELHGTGKNGHAHQDGPPEGKALAAHHEPIGQAQKSEPGTDGQGVGEGRAEGGGPGAVVWHSVHLL